MSTSALIGRRPIALSRFCSQSGEGPFLTPLTRRRPKAGHSSRRFDRNLDRAGERALHLLGRAVLEIADRRSGEVAGDAVDAGAVRPVGREVDLDHRIADAGPVGVGLADRRVGRQFDDAVVIVGDLKFAAEHSMPRLSTPRMVPTSSVMFLPGMKVPGAENTPFMPARALGAPQTTCIGLAVADVDHADAQLVGVRMLLGGDDVGDDESLEQRRLVLDTLDLEPDHGELVGDCRQRLDRCRGALSARTG